jgi:hypothetical protein
MDRDRDLGPLYVCCTCHNRITWTNCLRMCPHCGGFEADEPAVADATRQGGTVKIDSPPEGQG